MISVISAIFLLGSAMSLPIWMTLVLFVFFIYFGAHPLVGLLPAIYLDSVFATSSGFMHMMAFHTFFVILTFVLLSFFRKVSLDS
ncbi:hypothetical protein KC842_00865 [Candidatus Nomurabacteria bacterium]|nr:hypothetical protein [Candidatus Nomurabacteria bacterium]USN95032.1 MAG: hypothetical protein H6791_01210 [Candidatus Nomurabacteria bacterium]